MGHPRNLQAFAKMLRNHFPDLGFVRGPLRLEDVGFVRSLRLLGNC